MTPFLFICDECNYAHAEVLKSKGDAPAALERFTNKIRGLCGAKFGRNNKQELIVVNGFFPLNLLAEIPA